MKIELDKSLALPVSQEAGWSLVGNIEGIVACLPGAKITERIDDSHFKGTVLVKLGPATVSFKGDIEILERNDETHTMHLVGRGNDATGSSAASLNLVATVVSTGVGSCELTGRSEVSVSGKVAAFGSRLMSTVTDQLLKIFFANILAQAKEIQAVEPAASAIRARPGIIDAAPKEIRFNAIGFIFAVLKQWIAGLFSRTKTS
jgi:carbon monoxide dehydrogenase subunit G